MSIQDIELRVERRLAYGTNNASDHLQFRKLVLTHYEREVKGWFGYTHKEPYWRRTWTEWQDVPVVEKP